MIDKKINNQINFKNNEMYTKYKENNRNKVQDSQNIQQLLPKTGHTNDVLLIILGIALLLIGDFLLLRHKNKN